MPPRTTLGLFLACSLTSPALHAGDGSFSDQTANAGIDAVHNPAYSAGFLAGGAVGDFNGDGWQDIYFPTGGIGSDKLYINQGDGTFVDEALAFGLATPHRGTAAIAGDYDGDGWLDLFVTSLGSAAIEAPGGHRLYQNQGGQGFVDKAAVAGVATSSQSIADGWGGAWGDYDRDGDLDLAVVGWRTGDGNQLFRNDGDGTFTNVTAAVGLDFSNMVGFTARFADMDGDLWPELIWIGDFGTSQYYINNGGTFTDATTASGTSLDGTEMGMTVTDFDEDGDLDFYVTTIFTNNLYVNQGGHVFQNLAVPAGVEVTGWGWGTVAIDFNHDSAVDLVATSQSSSQFAFVNRTPNGGALTFDPVAPSIGLTSTVSGRGLSNFDYDNDGDQDLLIFPSQGALKLFRNDLSGPDRGWLNVTLEPGNTSDVPPSGIGAIVRVTTGTETQTRLLDGGSNYLSNSELSAHFGLGSTTSVDELRVEWPDGGVSTWRDLPVDQAVSVRATTGGYCVAGANSTGSGAVIDLEGSISVAANDFTLNAVNLPPNRPGIFYFGAGQVEAPFGEGVRCVGGQVFRYPPVFADATGVLSYTPDLTLPNSAGNLVGGSVWNFQAWYRDQTGGPSGFNLSNAIEIAFTP